MVQCPSLPARPGEAGGARELYAGPVPAMGPGTSWGEGKGFSNASNKIISLEAIFKETAEAPTLYL